MNVTDDDRIESYAMVILAERPRWIITSIRLPICYQSSPFPTDSTAPDITNAPQRMFVT